MRHGFTVKFLGALVLLLTTGGIASAQNPVVSHPTSSAISPALSDLPTAHWAPSSQGLKLAPPPKPLRPRGAGPGGASSGDAALQREPGPDSGIQPKANFGGIGANGYIPPDPNIAVGKTISGFGYIVQVVNSQIAVFNKSGALVHGPVALSSLWSALGSSNGCATNNAGDPIVQYDNAAPGGRWVVTQLGSLSAPYSECIAVSKTGDPGGAYYLYSYSFGSNLNDYQKLGIWPTATNSAYLTSANLFASGQTFIGAALCAYDRSKMLVGNGTAAQICFTVSNGGFLPADVDGATAPSAGTPGYFLNFETLSSLRLYQLSPNFSASPPSAMLTQVTSDIPVASFGEACGGGTCIAQPNSQQLDSLGDRLMYRRSRIDGRQSFGDGGTAGAERRRALVRVAAVASPFRPVRLEAPIQLHRLLSVSAGNLRAGFGLSLDGQRGDGQRRKYRARLQQIERQRQSVDCLHQPHPERHPRRDEGGNHPASGRRGADHLFALGRLLLAADRSRRR